MNELVLDPINRQINRLYVLKLLHRNDQPIPLIDNAYFTDKRANFDQHNCEPFKTIVDMNCGIYKLFIPFTDNHVGIFNVTHTKNIDKKFEQVTQYTSTGLTQLNYCLDDDSEWNFVVDVDGLQFRFNDDMFEDYDCTSDMYDYKYDTNGKCLILAQHKAIESRYVYDGTMQQCAEIPVNIFVVYPNELNEKGEPEDYESEVFTINMKEVDTPDVYVTYNDLTLKGLEQSLVKVAYIEPSCWLVDRDIIHVFNQNLNND